MEREEFGGGKVSRRIGTWMGKTQILLPVDNLKSGTNSLLRLTEQKRWVEALETDSKSM